MGKEFSYDLIFIFSVIVVAIVLSIIIKKALQSFIDNYSTKINADPTNFSFLKSSINSIIFVIALILIFQKIPYLKGIGTGLFAGAGVLAAIIGFAAQKAFSNIVHGIFILMFKPFRVGDYIYLAEDRKGKVEEITLRHTVVKNNENRRVIIPNNLMGENVIINSTIGDVKIRQRITFSISYASNIDLALHIIREEAEQHPLTLDTRSEEEIKESWAIVLVRVIELNDYSVDIRAFIWCADHWRAKILRSDLLKNVKERFDKEGVEIPFPYRNLIIKNEIDPDSINKNKHDFF